MSVRGIGQAHIGQRRQRNEDCWLADDQFGLYVVADGMGGHRAGDEAARIAVETVATTVRAERACMDAVAAGQQDEQALADVLRRAFAAANSAVRGVVETEPAKEGMGCTLTALWIVGAHGVMAHVGDSRLYICRSQEVEQLSQDHTVAAQLARQGVISEDSVAAHRLSNVLFQAIGIDVGLEPEILPLALHRGDRLLLCSDGFSNYISDAAWLASELSAEDLEGIPTELVNYANQCGGADNITALVVDVSPDPSERAWSATGEVRQAFQALCSNALFAELSLVRQAHIAKYCSVQAFAPGQSVVEQGQPLLGLTLVVEGKLVIVHEGAELGALAPGEHFGGAALLNVRPARTTVRASDHGPARTLTLTPEAFRDLAADRPHLGNMLLRRVAAPLSAALDERLRSQLDCPPYLAP